MQLRYPKKQAFTMIELLMIIIIIAVVSAIVVPAYAKYWATARFESTVHQVEEMISEARDKSIELDTTTTVSFDKQSQTFMVMLNQTPPQTDQPSNMTNLDQQNALMAQNSIPTTVILGGDVGIVQFQAGGFAASSPNAANRNSNSGSSNELHFQGDGSCDGAHITVGSSFGNTADLIVWPANGRLTREN